MYMVLENQIYIVGLLRHEPCVLKQGVLIRYAPELASSDLTVRHVLSLRGRRERPFGLFVSTTYRIQLACGAAERVS